MNIAIKQLTYHGKYKLLAASTEVRVRVLGRKWYTDWSSRAVNVWFSWPQYGALLPSVRCRDAKGEGARG